MSQYRSQYQSSPGQGLQEPGRCPVVAEECWLAEGEKGPATALSNKLGKNGMKRRGTFS